MTRSAPHSLARFEMASEIRPFLYKPLKYHGTECTEIRLLTLDPGRRNSKVRATLSHASFDQPPPYEALSYVWGNPVLKEDGFPPKTRKPKKRRFLRLNGQSFAVGNNLYSALQHLRHDFESRTLWIDAVCIDQHNKDERGRQVRIMDQIYAKSSLVLAWLGKSDKDSDAALNAIEDIVWAVKIKLMDHCAIELGIPLGGVSSESIKNMKDPIFNEETCATTGPFDGLYKRQITELMACLERVDVHVPPDAQSIESIRASSSKSMSLLREQLLSRSPINMEIHSLKATLQSLERFFAHRSYWSRLWIVQETSLASNVQLICGSTSLDYETLLIIYTIYSSIGNRHQDAPSAVMLHFAGRAFHQSLCNAMQPVNNRIRSITTCRLGGRLRLSSVILNFTELSCTEPVDKIYALLGLSQAINITPDYERPPAEVFIATTKAII